ncbi:MAG: M20/M25/M40 family metallo-hydrolase [Deltaproteobacteria bacterium]|nr:M20/M25/M40 family metallo-hydrolase [Deltaproteobacteria bacterium]
MGKLDSALSDLRTRGPEMLELTRRWVEINSYTANVAGVDAVGGLLREAFALPSLALTEIPAEGFGTHLVWRTAAAGAPILLVGHHDTVFPPGHFEGWTEDGNGRAVGPGALDMKGGLAVIRTTLAALESASLLAQLPIVVVSVSDEEVGSPTSAPHLKKLAAGASCALVFESGRANDMIITRRKGVGAMQVVAHGKAAHAGNNHKDGANAIWALSRFVDAAQKLTSYERGVTVNVGQMTGGTSKNTVPERAECALDMRYETVAEAEALVAALRAAADEAAAAVPGVRIEVSGGANRLPLERTSASAALRDEYAACARAAGLGDGEAPLLGGGSDANTVAPLGVPAIDGLGPRGAGFHTTTEYVELATFLPKAEALLRFLCGRLD